MTMAVSEVLFQTEAGSLAVSDITYYAEPGILDGWAVSEVSFSATPTGTDSVFVMSGGQWRRATPYVWESGNWVAI